jgi:hypothetical protein
VSRFGLFSGNVFVVSAFILPSLISNVLCVPGHCQLWADGIECNDISIKNLMYDKTNKCGILNDYDLAHWTTQRRPTGMEHTGTRPFMALDLLAMRPGMARLKGFTAMTASHLYGYCCGCVTATRVVNKSTTHP